MMFYKKRKAHQYQGRWFVKLLETVLIVGIIFFGFRSLEQVSLSGTVNQSDVRQINLTDNSQQQDASYYLRRAQQYHNMSDYQNAILDYSQALRLNMQWDGVWLNRGVAYERLGLDNLAMTDFTSYLSREALAVHILPVVRESTTLTLTMSEDYRFNIPIDIKEDSVLNISAVSVVEDIVDPIIVLLDNDGMPIAANDDVVSADDQLISMNAYLRHVQANANDTLLLMISHAGGGSYGDIDVSIGVKYAHSAP